MERSQVNKLIIDFLGKNPKDTPGHVTKMLRRHGILFTVEDTRTRIETLRRFGLIPSLEEVKRMPRRKPKGGKIVRRPR